MREDGILSLWLCRAESEDAFRKALDLEFSEDGDFLGSDFSRAFNVGHYEDATREVVFINSSGDSLAEMLSGVSYDDILLPRLNEMDILVEPGTNGFILIYNHRHVGQKSAALAGVSFVFMGSVAYYK